MNPERLVMFGGDKEVTIAQGLATTKVAGVITDSYVPNEPKQKRSFN